MHGESESIKQKTYVSAILYKILRWAFVFVPTRKQTKRMLIMRRMNPVVVQKHTEF